MSEIFIIVPDALDEAPDAVESLFAILHCSSTRTDALALERTGPPQGLRAEKQRASVQELLCS